jgi:hypothetical protein
MMEAAPSRMALFLKYLIILKAAQIFVLVKDSASFPSVFWN